MNIELSIDEISFILAAIFQASKDDSLSEETHDKYNELGAKLFTEAKQQFK